MKEAQQHLDSFTNCLLNSSGVFRKRIARLNGSNNTAYISDISVSESVLWISFTLKENTQTISIPIPELYSNGNYIITTQSGASRPVGSWLIDKIEYSYWQLMEWLFTKRVDKYLPTSSEKPYVERLLSSFNYNQAPLVFRNLQRIIDDFVNGLPLVGTDMQAWAMCNRVQVIDPEWGVLTPKQALKYQSDLNREMFPWTSLGQSDSGMCNNTLLTVDVRKTIPFGIAHHNPRRNLYQTLGMKGDEIPHVMSATEKSLADKGIVRHGWSLMTVFLDLPLNYEDQIIVSNRLADLFVEEERKYICYGNVIVEEGDETFFLHPLSIEPDGTIVKFDMEADSAVVKSIESTQVNFNGTKTKVKSITIKLKRLFKDGLKLTNRHGNKGVISLADTGVVHDPVRGDIPIDIIVSAKSVTKRKNFGQLLEALTTLVHGKTEIVVNDNAVCHIDKIADILEEGGYNRDGTCNITTQWGNFKAVSGWVHWGCIKTPEDQVWTRYNTQRTDNNDLRVAGNKFSHIEARALVTMFGPGNAVLREILNHRQGHDIVFEMLRILDTMRGNFPKLPEITYDKITPIDQKEGFFHNLADFSGSVADTNFYEHGFYIKLPDNLKYVITDLGNGKFGEGLVNNFDSGMDKIMAPPSKYRLTWKHQSGKYGLSDIAALLNNIVRVIHQYKSGEATKEHLSHAIYMYFHGINRSVSTKNGAISNFCMSVRYPWTVKGTAAVSDNLDKNEIEIHTSLAKNLGVFTGDFVLVERFPCLGFMSLRVQRVKVTDDPNCRYVIRVSGNSLTSQALDFDGDVLYLMSFHTVEANDVLRTEFYRPSKARMESYDESSNRKPVITHEMNLEQYDLEVFPHVTAEQNAEIVAGLTGIKRGTGTIIALCYNLMRILERNVGYTDLDISVALEKLLDKVANSVFSMKHAGRSLEAECREAICTANEEKMLDLGLDPIASKILADIIIKKAKEVGVDKSSLNEYFQTSEENGYPSIVNKIIRKDHRIWLTSRSNLHPITMLSNLETNPEDLTGWMYRYAKNQWEEELKHNNILKV